MYHIQCSKLPGSKLNCLQVLPQSPLPREPKPTNMTSPTPPVDTSVSPPPPLSPTSKILILGSGVFGLSTALWLRRSGYEDVTVLDMQDTAGLGYAPGAVDSASADLNKIIRFSYGAEIEYQRLATEAAGLWDEWNAQIAAVQEEAELPESLRGGERRLWWKSGMLRMSGGGELGGVELQTLENMAAEGLRDGVFRSDDEVGRLLPPALSRCIYLWYRNGKMHMFPTR